jgi:hypothetical protein
VSKKNMGDRENHTLPRQEGEKKSARQTWVPEKSMHLLETRRRAKVSKTNMGDGGKAHTS